MNISKILLILGRLPEIYKALVAFLAAIVGSEAAIVAALNGVAPAGWVQAIVAGFGVVSGVLVWAKGNAPSPAVVAATEAAATTGVVVDQVTKAIEDFRKQSAQPGFATGIDGVTEVVTGVAGVAIPVVGEVLKSVEDILAQYRVTH